MVVSWKPEAVVLGVSSACTSSHDVDDVRVGRKVLAECSAVISDDLGPLSNAGRARPEPKHMKPAGTLISGITEAARVE